MASGSARRRGSPPASPLLLTALVACTSLSACGPADPLRDWTGTVDTLATGTVVVRNPAEGLWSADEAWTLEEELRIGTLMDEGPELFGRVRDVLTDDLGRIFVLESQADEVRLFDSDGTYIRTLGRKGEGPGELQAAQQLLWSPDRNLWIWDSSNRRFTVFDTSGVFVADHPMDPGRINFGPHLFHGDGTLDVRSYVTRGGSAEAGWAYVRHRTGPDGLEAFDTLPVPELDEPPERTTGPPVVRGQMMVVEVMSLPFAPTPIAVPDLPGGYWVSRYSTDYHLAKTSPAGDTLLVVEREHTPRPVTEAEIDEFMGRFGGDPPFDRDEIPSIHPPFEDVHVGVDGELWVEREDAEGVLSWDLFEPDGLYLGVVRLPDGVRGFDLHHITRDAIYGRALGDFDEQYVVRLAIRRGER